MKLIKVGDWVTLLDKWVHKVEAVSKSGRALFLNTREIPQADNWWDIDQCTPWEQKVGEWCWYGYELVQVIDRQPSHIKICRQQSDTYEEVQEHRLEPFIGILPSFIKEQ